MIGLGVSEGDLTLKAKTALDGADRILVRTAQTSSFKSLDGYVCEPLDALFTSSRSFDALNRKLARAVISAAKEGNVCYCVDGAVSEDEACKLIMKSKKCEVIEGVSKTSHAAALANLKSGSVCGVSAYSAETLKSCSAAVIYDIDCDFAASKAKCVLTELFGEETECAFIRGEKAEKIKVYEIDRRKTYDYSCAVAVEEGEFLDKARYDYADLLHMLRILRAPNGCPWDRAQTNESIKGNMIEEAYELVDAVERADDDGIEEETGDVLMQAAFHSVLKQEQGVFTSGDALTRVVKKLIFRHSHIFGKDRASSETEALGVWEKNKAKEKSQTTYGETVAAVPKNLPSAMRAQKVQKRAAKSGMDFISPISAAEKLYEEVAELLDELIDGDKERVFDEAGDVLFSAVNVVRLSGVDSEEALRAAVNKFSARFIECERQIIADGKKMDDMLDDELDWYWLRAKNALEKH